MIIIKRRFTFVAIILGLCMGMLHGQDNVSGTIKIKGVEDIARERNPELFLPKDEFETKAEYSKRVARQKALLKDIRAQLLTEFNALPESNRFAPQYRQHRVRPGESLSAIAKKYRVSMHELASVNKITNYNQISEGTKLTIPVPSSAASGPVATASPKKPQETISYKVRSGDTLGHIAERYGTSARDIRQWNGLKYGAHIYPGQKLTIPKKSSSKLASSVKGGSDKEIYVVREGDTLGHIATRYRVDINKIERWNNISRKRAIRPGQKLVIHIK